MLSKQIQISIFEDDKCLSHTMQSQQKQQTMVIFKYMFENFEYQNRAFCLENKRNFLFLAQTLLQYIEFNYWILFEGQNDQFSLFINKFIQIQKQIQPVKTFYEQKLIQNVYMQKLRSTKQKNSKAGLKFVYQQNKRLFFFNFKQNLKIIPTQINVFSLNQTKIKIYSRSSIKQMEKFASLEKERSITILNQLEKLVDILGYSYQMRLKQCRTSGTTKISLENQLQKVKQELPFIEKQNIKELLQKYIKNIQQYITTINSQKQLKSQQTNKSLKDQHQIKVLNFLDPNIFKSLQEKIILSGGAACSLVQNLSQQQKENTKIINDLDFVGDMSSINSLKLVAKSNPDEFVITFERKKFISGFYCISRNQWVQISVAFEQKVQDRKVLKIGNLNVFTIKQLLKNNQFDILKSKNQINQDQMKSFQTKFQKYYVSDSNQQKVYGIRKQKSQNDKQNIETIIRLNKNKSIQSRIKIFSKLN